MSTRSPRWVNKSQRRRRGRPTHFVAFRITSPRLITQVERLQSAIRDFCPEAASCLIDPRTLHVTLCVLRLPDGDAIERACQVLHSEGARASTHEFSGVSPPSFDFNGWGFFGNNDVLYAKMDMDSMDGKRLSAVAEHIHHEFDRSGLTTETFRRPYTPHLTVWKSSCDRNLIKNINTSRGEGATTVQDGIYQLVKSYASAADAEELGSDHPRSMELLAMKEKDENGYYKQLESAFWCS
ncbi:hypothetical protein PHYBOEH_011662 [Phytophthora boehmeriae]|uniref:A-kinase anchor protein 7-like phosphoesterase domain-containing protein n=1 Tax=Phytophthora boehmeriae TaxID=109152 RepID=A0A8T1WXE8_9STRA|nr:hypothetical protein PHYBOEH_011662 [Phytophthora boehmeriae]